MSVSIRVEMVEDSSFFFQKSNSMLSPDELEVVGLLELQGFIEAKSVEFG